MGRQENWYCITYLLKNNCLKKNNFFFIKFNKNKYLLHWECFSIKESNSLNLIKSVKNDWYLTL